MTLPLVMILLMGAPGSGKGTQSKLLEDALGYHHLATGDLIRAEIARHTPLGKDLEQTIGQGKLVPDDIVYTLLKEAIQQDFQKGIILDGFPRTIAQAQMLEKLAMEMGIHMAGTFSIDVPDQVIIERLSSRVYCTNCGATFNLQTNPPKQENVCDYCSHSPLIQRHDDQPATIRRRLEDYHQKKHPIKAFYEQKGLWQEIDGIAEPKVICARIVEILKNNMKNDKPKT